MDRQVPCPDVLKPLQHRLAGVGQRLGTGTAQPETFDERGFSLEGLLQACIHHIGRLDRAFHRVDEILVTFAQQIAHDHRMRMLEVSGCHDVRVSVDPQHRKVTVVTFVQVGEWREVDQTVATQNHQPVRLMPVDQLPCKVELREQRMAGDNAVFQFKRLIIGFGYGHVLDRP